MSIKLGIGTKLAAVVIAVSASAMIRVTVRNIIITAAIVALGRVYRRSRRSS